MCVLSKIDDSAFSFSSQVFRGEISKMEYELKFFSKKLSWMLRKIKKKKFKWKKRKEDKILEENVNDWEDMIK